MIRFISLVFVLLVVATPIIAQDTSGRAFSRDNKRAVISRIATAPIIDGVLDDMVWAQVIPLDDFHQYDPIDHAEPTERMQVYLAYDEDNLYVAARMWDSEPDQIRALQLAQGGSGRWDDGFAIYLDPFNNKRTGYWFQTNPNGVRADGYFESATTLNREWEGIWFNGAQINDEGWAAEMAIPFKTLNFEVNNTDWGFSAERVIARKQERISWSSYNRAVDPGSIGVVSGFSDLRQGRGLDIVPSLVTSGAKDFKAGVKKSDTEPALDVFYNFTPSLTGVLTLNTDFSSTEVDDQRVNLTRFSLFFPEKRDFFLQDVDIFSFGGLDRNAIPFHSRRIGLSSRGQPVDMEFGAKVTGRVGRFNIGVLGVEQEGFENINSSNLFVGRIAANVLSESSVGLIMTDGDPRTNMSNSVFGADFRYRNTNLPSGHSLEGEAWYQSSDTQGVKTDQDAWGIRLESPNNDGFSGEFEYQHIEENYNPALGFVNRKGIENTDVSIGYTNRFANHGWLRAIESQIISRNYALISGGLESRLVFIEPFELETNNGDQFGMQLSYEREVLLEPFEIFDGIVIPVGDYEFTRFGFEATGAQERAFGPMFEITNGEFFNGDRSEISVGGEWRPNNRLRFGLGYEYNDIDLLEGSFITRQIRINVDLSFNSRWSWANLLQYDNESGSAGVNSRLRWNPRAGQDLFIVLNHGFSAMRTFRDLASTQSQFSVKYTQTFRF